MAVFEVGEGELERLRELAFLLGERSGPAGPWDEIAKHWDQYCALAADAHAGRPMQRREPPYSASLEDETFGRLMDCLRAGFAGGASGESFVPEPGRGEGELCRALHGLGIRLGQAHGKRLEERAPRVMERWARSLAEQRVPRLQKDHEAGLGPILDELRDAYQRGYMQACLVMVYSR